jgi:2-dehydro-3-deoxygalactonokinase
VSAVGLIGLDWGTSSARAYRVGGNGEVQEVRSGPFGVQQVRDGGFADALATLLGDWQALPVPRLACGMIGSRQGWMEVPYRTAPASLDSLAAGIARVPGSAGAGSGSSPLAIVPGVATRESDGTPDVMRGEETQVLGAAADAPARALVVLPGTHSKWVRVEQGAIAGFVTYLTGELYAALLGHTILGRLATPASAFDAASFARGVSRGLGGGALAHDVFGARTLALFGELSPEGVGDWLSGLLVGAEIAAARAVHRDVSSVHIVGDEALCQRYAAACAQAGWTATIAAPLAAARGLWQLARAAALV